MSRNPFPYAVLLCLLILCAGCKPENIVKADSPDRLAAPNNDEALKARKGKQDIADFKCKSAPKAVLNLKFESIYDPDSANASVIDPKARDAYKKATKPLNTFETGLSHMANRYVRSSPARDVYAQCALDWLYAWADSGAMLGKVNRTGEFVRKWVLSSLSSSWMQVMDEKTLDPEKKAAVNAWLGALARTVMTDFSKNSHLKSRNNNHLYWSAWAVMATGVALNDQGMFDWGLDKGRQGILDIAEDGTLALEMARGSKALNYHSYAAIPLFLIAETAMKNGIDLYAENNFGLFRLGKRTVSGLEDTSYFVEKAGEKQDIERITTSSNLVWLEIYNTRAKDTNAQAWLDKLRPMKLSRVGGNATFLYGP